LLAGWGFIDPVFSVFHRAENTSAHRLITVGIAAAIYWLSEIDAADSDSEIPRQNRLARKMISSVLVGGLLLAGISAGWHSALVTHGQ
jgi:hypothetical protein